MKATTQPDAATAAAEGAKVLAAGGLVGFAAETVYGIAALATSREAMERLRRIKDRPDRPFTVHLAGVDETARYVARVPDTAQKLMAKAWPGPITLILPVGGRLVERALQKAGLYQVLCWEDLIGLRCPAQPTARAMLSAAGGPVVAPSANPAGAAPPRTAEEVLTGLDGQIDLLLDTGPTRYGVSSTVVRVEGDGRWQVLREGVYDERGIKGLLGTTLLFVCTGNTCRSPIAAGLARKLLAQRAGASEEELTENGYEVLSAGVWAAGTGRATPEAVDAAAELGADIAAHQPRRLSVELINRADVIFCMSSLHVEAVCRLVPSAAGKVMRLLPDRDIADPLGGGGDVYRRTAREIEQALKDGLNQRVP